VISLDARALAQALPYPDLIDAINDAFKGGVTVPLRAHHTIPGLEGGSDNTLLLMPAWSDDGFIGVKTAVVAPDNRKLGLPAVQVTYQLLERETGRPLASMDGPMLTARRTAAASALAARYLAPEGASKLLMIGTGLLAGELPLAHAAVRPISAVKVWGRDPAKAGATAESLSCAGLNAVPTTDLEKAVGWADIVSAATLSREPLIQGAWLHPGQHVDLVGAFRPDMREADDVAVTRARVFCDTREGALKEGGDLAQPLRDGVFSAKDVEGDLFDLAAGQVAIQRRVDDITLFKSTGTALEDLAGAMLAYRRCAG
jgi:alanine dehydrogenase